jgi:transcriptional regulator with XRE-family HTH domain
VADRSHVASRSERIWEQRRALGRRLAALRSRAGFSQWEFAPLTGYSRSTLSDAELGRHRLRREFWQRCDDALRADGALIAAYDRIEVQASAARRSARSQAMAVREEQASQRLHALLPDEPSPAAPESTVLESSAPESTDPEAPRTVVERCPHCRQPVTVMIMPAPRTP